MADNTANYGRTILKHYFQLAIEAGGKRWDSDCAAEIDAAIDSIIEAARNEGRES